MRCPACEETRLTMADRQGVEIDYCPDCRGVWLDRGELDKLIDRAMADAERDRPRAAAHSERDEPRDVRRERYDDDDDDRERPAKRGRRRESFLGEFFDFGG